MSLQTEHTSSSPLKRRRSSSSSFNDENERNSKHLHSHQPSLVALPPPMLSDTAHSTSSASALPTPSPSPAALSSSSGVAYYPVYTAHSGHFYLASPPLHPSSPSHATKILPKLPTQHQAPPTPATLPSSPSSLPYTFYHPYQLSPPIQPVNPSVYHHQHHPPHPTTSTTADQREQARKVSHSAIERRRRERINDKIMQLKQLIPTCANQENLHKMSILQSSIDYITYLKDILEQIEKQGGGKVVDLVPHQGKLTSVKTPRSMLPKEVEQYTSQFNAHQARRPSSPPTMSLSSSSSSSSANDNIASPSKHQQPRCLKPMDIIQSKNQPILSSPPPSSTSSSSSSSGRTTPLLSSEAIPSSPKNMSLKNLLC
ncbi:unnamed protein product [Absidia cylindrospora]